MTKGGKVWWLQDARKCLNKTEGRLIFDLRLDITS